MTNENPDFMKQFAPEDVVDNEEAAAKLELSRKMSRAAYIVSVGLNEMLNAFDATINSRPGYQDHDQFRV